jgi:hypothetical protein
MTADTPSPSEVVEKLTALRVMCESCNQPLYVEILDEVLSALSSPRSSTVDDLAEKIGRALANDPVCGGRVCQDTVDYIASLLVAPATVDEATSVAVQPIGEGE